MADSTPGEGDEATAAVLGTSSERVGWQRTACNRYFQTAASESAPTACAFCGSGGPRWRIEHVGKASRTDIEVGDIVAAARHGETDEYVVGEVLDVSGNGIRVRAREGPGEYRLAPTQVVHVRTDT